MEPAVPGAPVEYDDKGVPYYKWPPFPIPPPGVNIVPFKDFKPSGIQVMMMDEEVELDGENIPTVHLPVTHDSEARPKKKQKTKKTAGGEIMKRKPWWEEWAEGEDLRSNFKYDEKLHMTDRLTSAALDFRKQRTWPPRTTEEKTVEDRWAMFQVFTGIIGGGSRQINACENDDDVDSEVDDDSDYATEAKEVQTAQPIVIHQIDLSQDRTAKDVVPAEPTEEENARRLNELQTRESRMDRFLKNPMGSMKIFFSSYFRVSGMMWENSALRDCPRVVLFFLNFLIRNQALGPKLQDKLRKAIAIAEKAKEELPQTKIIGLAIPDELSQCFTALFGSKIPNVWRCLKDDDPKTTIAEPPADANANSDLEKLSEENNVLSLSASDDSPAPEPPAEDPTSMLDGSNFDAGGSGGWGILAGDTWASTSEARDTVAGEGTGQADDIAMDNPWAQSTSTAEWTIPEYFLMTLMGPTSLPLSHKVGYVEKSTRYIKSVTMPSDCNTAADLSMFAKVVLSPHKVFFGTYRAAIQAPQLLEDPYSEEAADSLDASLPRHNPRADDIVVYLLPKAAETLIVNMNLGGTFVQVVPDRSWQVPTRTSEGKDGSSEQRQSDETFWYCEHVTQILPSFWYEMQPEPRPNVSVGAKSTSSENPV